MAPSPIEVIGIGILCVIILKEVFSFIRTVLSHRNNGNGKTKIDLHDIKRDMDHLKDTTDSIEPQVKDLWTWHEKEIPGEPGVKVWYGSKRTEDALVEISESLKRLIVLTEQTHDMTAMHIAASTKPKRKTRKRKS
jgi:hypothetical protein